MDGTYKFLEQYERVVELDNKVDIFDKQPEHVKNRLKILDMDPHTLLKEEVSELSTIYDDYKYGGLDKREICDKIGNNYSALYKYLPVAFNEMEILKYDGGKKRKNHSIKRKRKSRKTRSKKITKRKHIQLFKKKTKKNNIKIGGWRWGKPYLSSINVVSEEEQAKAEEEYQTRKNIMDQLETLKISTLIKEESNLIETDITERDIIEYALFALDLNERCINLCNDVLCKSCNSAGDSKCEGVCNDFKTMRTLRNSYETTNFCGMDFMQNYSDTDNTYYCKKHIDMASIIRQVRDKFKTTNPELYDYLKYFDNTYKGKYTIDDVRNKLNSYTNKQNNVQNGNGNKSKTRKSKKT
jgi:hypothetical protein